jgi:hypothetical protein
MHGRALVLALFELFFFGAQAVAYPENFRHNYPSCTSCHFQPGGGGALTAYGRMTSNTVFSTVRTARPDYPDWLAIGLDYRRASVDVRSEGFRYRELFFHMQTEAELAIQPIKGLWAAATIGLYGPDEKQEFRRSYLLATLPGDMLRLRVGRFLPSYGINNDDHTSWARTELALGQRAEELGAEASVVSKWGEVIVARTYGTEAALRGSEGDGYVTTEEDPDSFYGRFSLYLASGYQAGGSVRLKAQDVDAAGIHVMASPADWVYLISEASLTGLRESYPEGEQPFVTATKLGFEPYRGNHIFLQHESKQGAQRFGLGARAFPAYGLDFLLKYARIWQEDLPHTDEIAAVAHIYL